ncbi:MAG: NAD-dependent epimerase/dehydratase family protein [Anaerolineaceae bacterium]|nr:NAD-dependent epimerase/dehydratase family protein [Anaerolineaceae bacterium]
MDADDRLKVFITGATTAPGLAIMRGFVAHDHAVAGNAATLAEAQRLRAPGGLPVYIDEHNAADLAGALRMTGANVLVHAAPLAANSLLPDADQLTAALASLQAGTDALLGAAAQVEDPFLVFCSYASLYGDTQGEAVCEAHEAAGGSALHEAALAAERKVLASEVPACILRAGVLYGPESESLAALRASLLGGGGLPSGIGEGLASWLHYEDLAQAAVLGAEQRPAGSVFNVADERPATRHEFLEHFAQRMGLVLPRPGRPGALLRRLPLPGRARGQTVSSFAVNCDAIRAALGWSPQYAGHDSGLEQTLLTWRAAAARG